MTNKALQKRIDGRSMVDVWMKKASKKTVIMFSLIIILLVASMFVVGAQFTKEKTGLAAPEDIAEVYIINPHSSPKAGDSWIVSFKTKGKADLIITPIEQATIDDLDFVSLKCGDKEINPQILENDIIFYPDWSCDETGQVNHLVNVRGKHTLEFQFDEDVEFAHNNPDTEILRPNEPGDVCDFNAESGAACPNHYLNVDEAVSDDGSTANRINGESGNPYYQDLFHIEDPTSEGTINSVTVYIRVQQPYYDIYAYINIKPSDTTYKSTLITIPYDRTTYPYTLYSNTWTTNPDTSEGWAWDDISNLQIGSNQTAWWSSSENWGEARTTQVYAVVDYTPCTGTDTFTLRIYDPLGTEVKTCPQQSINPTGGNNCNSETTDSCSEYVTCQRVGQYNATITCDSCSVMSGVANQSVLNCTSSTTNKFIIRNSTGGDIAAIDEKGFMYITGENITNIASLNPQPGDFAIKGSGGAYVAYINKSNGALNLKGTFQEGQTDLSPPIGSFAVRNSSGDYVAYIDPNGNLNMTGWLYEKWLEEI